jgi:hypothetical protein
MNYSEVDAELLLRTVAAGIPADQRDKVVVIGSIATSWAFRGLMENGTVMTKDIDAVLRPAKTAVVTARSIGEDWIRRGWKPHYPEGQEPGTTATPTDLLPAMRLIPPNASAAWFVEMLGEPYPGQANRREWHRFDTDFGSFALPTFRFMRVAIHKPISTNLDIRVATPACMALAHLLEHAEPDTTHIRASGDPRFCKDVGRAQALWWLAGQTDERQAGWPSAWINALSDLFPGEEERMLRRALEGLAQIEFLQAESLAIAARSVLAPFSVSSDSWKRSYDGFHRYILELCAAG